MNRVFRVLWNKATESWVVVSELMTTRKKSGKVSICTAAALSALGASLSVWATDIGSLNFNPTDCDNTLCSLNISNGASETLSGSLTAINKGKTNQTSLTYEELVDFGLIISGSKDWERLNTGSKTSTVLVPDPNIPGSYLSVPVYNSANFSSGSWAMDPVTGEDLTYYVNTGDIHDMQYINARMGQVDSSGGQLTIDLGDPSKDINSNANYFSLVGKSGEAGKTASWFFADGTEGNSSEIVWSSKNSVFLGYYPASAVGGQEIQSVQRFQVPVYGGAFKVTDAKGNTTTHSVTDVISLGEYNNWVIDQLKKGNINASNYNTVLSYGYSFKTEELIYQSSSLVTAGDEVTLTPGIIALVQADGANALVRLEQQGDIEARVNSSNVVLYGSNNSTIINDGVLSGYNTGSSLSALSALVRLDAGSHFENNGLLNVGFLTNGEAIDTYNSADMFTARGVLVGSNGSVNNMGIINVGSANQPRQNQPNQLARGITLSASGSKGSNSGTINVAVNADGFSSQTTGVELVGKSSFAVAPEFTNSSDGKIYIGRSAQYFSGDGGKDLNLIGGIGVLANGYSRFSNAGSITIGTGSQGAIGIKLSAGSTGMNTNTGKIDVNSSVLGLQNIAVQAGDGSNFTHSGTINLNGVNQVGLKATTESLSGGEGKAATIVDAGVVNINGNMGEAGVRSYGLMAEGTSSLIDMQGGEINLNGDGAIGAYAVNGGRINIAADSRINFNGGVKGIGFLAYGKDSTINIAGNQPLDISIADSTLIRVENGATLGTQPHQQLIASGKNSTALVVSGEDSHANLDSLNFEITGVNSTALRVQGGATGEMSGASQLTLSDSTTAVVVDDIRYDVNGTAVGTGESLFTNTADISVGNARNVVLFEVNNGAELINTGNIDLHDGTAIILNGYGSTVSPDATGQFGSITVHDGHAGIQVANGATLNTSATITVNGAASALLVSADAGRVVVNKDAHFTGQSAGYGNIITNQSSSGNVLVDGATIEMSGSGAALLSENNIDSASHGHIIVSSKTGGKGIALSAVDGTKGNGSLEVTDNWLIDVTGNGDGVYANTSGMLVVSGNIHVSGTGNAIKSVAADSVYINSDAILTSENEEAMLVSGTLKTLINKGSLLARSVSDTAIKLSESSEKLINAGNGVVEGGIYTGAGDDTILYADNSVHNGILNTGDGDDTVILQGDNVTVSHLEGGTGHNSFILNNATKAQADKRMSQLLDGFQSVHLTNGTILNLKQDFWADELSLNTDVTERELYIDNSSTLTFTDNQLLSSDVINKGKVLFQGNTHSLTIEQDVEHAGVFALNANGSTGDTLLIDGNYLGSGGEIGFDVALNGDTDSPADRMVVKGNTSGMTFVSVSNAGGKGAQTMEGIELISVEGSSAGDFMQKGRIVAGAYDYKLVRGQGNNTANWYLSSSTEELPIIPAPEPETPEQPEEPVTPDLPENPGIPVTPDLPEKPEIPLTPEAPVAPEGPAPSDVPPLQEIPQDSIPVVVRPLPDPVLTPAASQVRPEAAAYADNLYAANTLFSLRLQDRLRELRTDEEQNNHLNSLWLRQLGGHLRSKDSSGQNTSHSKSYVTQLGSDISRWSSNGEDSVILGIMAGYANQNSKTHNHVTGYSARSSLSGYSIGLYGSWLQDVEEKSGVYIDAWGQYNWFKNSIKGELLNGENYRSRGVTASLETGYSWEASRGTSQRYFIQPQAQLIWTDVQTDEHIESNGTRVSFSGKGNIQSRVGIRTFTKANNRSMGNTEVHSLEPFTEVNWIHNSINSSALLDDIRVSKAGTRDLGEMKIGFESRIGQTASLKANITQQIGGAGYSNTQANIGFSLDF